MRNTTIQWLWAILLCAMFSVVQAADVAQIIGDNEGKTAEEIAVILVEAGIDPVEAAEAMEAAGFDGKAAFVAVAKAVVKADSDTAPDNIADLAKANPEIADDIQTAVIVIAPPEIASVIEIAVGEVVISNVLPPTAVAAMDLPAEPPSSVGGFSITVTSAGNIREIADDGSITDIDPDTGVITPVSPAD